MMSLHFRQEMATQAAARLLSLRGGTMSYLKLLKLLYLADRKALLEHGRPITFDRYVCMDHGPVLSQTYNLMVGEEDPSRPNYWRRYISEPKNYEVSLVSDDVPNAELSPVQEQLLDEIFEKYGRMGRWELVRLTHTLGEWRDPRGSSVSIDIEEILKAGGVGESERERIEEGLVAEEALALLDWAPQPTEARA